MVSGLCWGVMPRLVKYVGGLPDGEIMIAKPAEVRNGTFWYPAPPASDVLAFGGGVRFRGHFGMLDIELKNPRISADEVEGVLLFPNDSNEYAPFAHLERSTSQGDETVQVWTATLTESGASALGGVYPVGTPLADLYIES